MRLHEIAALTRSFRQFEKAAAKAAWSKLKTPSERYGWNKALYHVDMDDEGDDALVIVFQGSGVREYETLEIKLTQDEAEAL